MWICLGMVCCIGELLMVCWEYVNFEIGEWFVLVGNIKIGVDWCVYLFDFVCCQFKVLYVLIGDILFCFLVWVVKGEEFVQYVCVKSVFKQIGDCQMQFKCCVGLFKNCCYDNSLMLVDGVNGEWILYDLCCMVVIMMQVLGVLFDIIDCCQNYVFVGGCVCCYYLYYDYVDEKWEVWIKLGERLDLIFDNVSVIFLLVCSV